MNFMKAINEVAKCAVCLDRVTLPLTACVNGHAICKSCTSSLTKCPTCQKGFLLNPPTLLEQIIAIIPKPCKYVQRGCKQRFERDSKSHEECCRYRPINCCMGEVEDCTWTGEADDWKSHLEENHPEQHRDFGSESEFFVPTNKRFKKYYAKLLKQVVVLLLKQNHKNELLITLRCIPTGDRCMYSEWVVIDIKFFCHKMSRDYHVPIAVKWNENVPVDDPPFDYRVPIPWVLAENMDKFKMRLNIHVDLLVNPKS